MRRAAAVTRVTHPVEAGPKHEAALGLNGNGANGADGELREIARRAANGMLSLSLLLLQLQVLWRQRHK